MLHEKYRLKHRRDFTVLLKEGRFVRGEYMNLQVWKIPERHEKIAYSPQDLKIAFVVGVKASKIAVLRNRAKRQMREAVRLLLKADRIKKGYLLSFVARREIVGSESAAIANDVMRLLERAGVLLP